MTTLKELLAQRHELEQRIDELRKVEGVKALSQIHALISEHGFSSEDIFPKDRGAKAVKSVSKVQPKYRDPKTGKTWSGRGMTPVWLKDKDRSDFLIASA